MHMIGGGGRATQFYFLFRNKDGSKENVGSMKTSRRSPTQERTLDGHVSQASTIYIYIYISDNYILRQAVRGCWPSSIVHIDHNSIVKVRVSPPPSCILSAQCPLARFLASSFAQAAAPSLTHATGHSLACSCYGGVAKTYFTIWLSS